MAWVVTGVEVAAKRSTEVKVPATVVEARSLLMASLATRRTAAEATKKDGALAIKTAKKAKVLERIDGAMERERKCRRSRNSSEEDEVKSARAERTLGPTKMARLA